MTDVAIVWNDRFGTGDLAVEGADLMADDTLRTAVLVSLFTDARVSADELPPGDTDRRGWFGNLVDPDAPVGSKLWLLERSKLTPAVLVRAEQYARDALGWMVRTSAAVSVTVRAELVRRGVMGITVEIRLPSGDTVDYQFSTPMEA